MYTNVVRSACLERINQYSSVQKKSKEEVNDLESRFDPNYFSECSFSVILEHCDVVQMTVAVPSQPFNEPVCLCVCAYEL